MAKVFVVVRGVVERTLLVEVPNVPHEDASQPEAFEAAEDAVKAHIAREVDFYRLVPGQNIDDTLPWQWSELDYPYGDVEAYDWADADADRIDVRA